MINFATWLGQLKFWNRLIFAKSFARIHWQNLVNSGILPLKFDDPADWDKIIDHCDVLAISDMNNCLHNDNTVKVVNTTKNETYQTTPTSYVINPRL